MALFVWSAERFITQNARPRFVFRLIIAKYLGSKGWIRSILYFLVGKTQLRTNLHHGLFLLGLALAGGLPYEEELLRLLG